MTRLKLREAVVLVGIEADFAPDVIDSIQRIGAEVAATVQLGEKEWNLEGLSPYSKHSVPSMCLSHPFFVTWNTPGLRRLKLIEAEQLGFSSLVTIIDPTATVSSSAEVGSGVYINAAAVIAAQATLGNSVFVNRLAGVGHHSVLEDFVSVGPGASIASKVKIGRGAMIGAGASIAPSVTIGSNSVISAGAAVHKDVPPNVVVVGNPSRIAKTGIVGHRGFGV